MPVRDNTKTSCFLSSFSCFFFFFRKSNLHIYYLSCNYNGVFCYLWSINSFQFLRYIVTLVLLLLAITITPMLFPTIPFSFSFQLDTHLFIEITPMELRFFSIQFLCFIHCFFILNFQYFFLTYFSLLFFSVLWLVFMWS